ncbi:MAG: hypothetical protein IIU69_05745 [Bacteroidaceae bacterium]|jgi:cell fate regulator YaaT (PSP1 superfamily)|nr:hypothetical protein [Bacteroidaceae bacterium]
MDQDFILKPGCQGISYKGCGQHIGQLHSFNYLEGLPGSDGDCEYVEVQFKNTRKGFFLNANNLELEKGDIVAVESNPGHDIGTVTMTGRLVKLQMKKANLRPDIEIKRVYRKAREVDMEKFEEAKAREHSTMIRSRQIAKDLGLEMKIGDVEYQGDGNKAIFYYIADGRVDFRQLIKVLAENFRVRIEMKQIGARQEAGRIGGIGPCGRELCCSTWMTNFVSVSTGAARFQDLSMNPQKLAGQCAKLKCCLNYEVDTYVEAQKHFPSREVELYTMDNTYYFFKADILNDQLTYSTDKVFAANLETITSARALEIIGLNKKGIKPKSLNNDNIDTNTKVTSDILDEDGLTRFDSTKKKKKKKPIRKNFDQQDRTENNQQPQQPQNREDQHRRGRDGHWNRKDKFHKRNNNNNNNGEQ